MENVYFCSLRSGLFFGREFMFHMLYLFPISALVTRESMESPSEDVL